MTKPTKTWVLLFRCIVLLNEDVVFYADYYPFGTVVRSGGTGWRYGYQGENAEKDNETGWNSFELRNYDAAIGRWLSTDPYGQYASPYVGMGNNPVMMADVDGGWADGGDDPVKIFWKDYKEGQVIALDPVFVSAYYGGSIRAFTPDFWDNWASSKNWFSKITYNIADPFVVYGTSFFGDPMHIGGGRANRKELTEAGVAAITSAVPLEAAFAKGGVLAKGVVKEVLSNAELVSQAAIRAERAVGGTGRFAGTVKHTYATTLLERYQSIYGSSLYCAVLPDIASYDIATPDPSAG